MSKKRKTQKKRATKQPGTDRIMQDKETGLFFAVANVHTGRTTRPYQGPKKIQMDDAMTTFNDGLYRGIEEADDDGVV